MRKAHYVRSAPDTDAGRRRAPRLETGSVIHARCVDSSMHVRELRNIGAGGFSIETDVEVVPGQENRFELKTITGFSTVLGAVAIHGRRSESSRGYISGWRFADETEATEPVGRLLDILTSALEFDAETEQG